MATQQPTFTLNASDQYITAVFRRGTFATPIPKVSAGTLEKLTAARETLASSWILFVSEFEAAQKDRHLSPIGQTIRVLKAVDSVAPGAVKDVLAALGYASRTAQILEADANEAMTQAARADQALYAEMRGALLKRDPGARLAAIFAAIDEGELRLAWAVLVAPEICHGVTKAQSDEIRAKLRAAKVAGTEQYEAAEDIRNAAALVDAALQNFRDLVGKLCLEAWRTHGLQAAPETVNLIGISYASRAISSDRFGKNDDADKLAA